ncbi:unnamed protein product [Clonostachys rosea]|uniref:DUF3669 domain-containing protein n=1 Tax=Bionectria ochroleuca TaxID=29856 RepID=A0ABY6UK04_BIOOC|nr:unnamed protein product [Clonostachys rosea]
MDSLPVEATKPLRRIGAGHCGSVWAALASNKYPGLLIALKREDGSPGRSLRNEFTIQSQVYQLGLGSVLVPSPLSFIERSGDWSSILPHLPEGFEPCNAMMSEYIKPVSDACRQVLAERYCPQGMLPSQILNSPENEHCLVRIYLGRRRFASDDKKRHLSRFFSLRNFPLHMDQVEELGLTCDVWAKAMGGALATIHWKLRIDGADIEFVLGAPRDTLKKADNLNESALWVLDFDCCKPITPDSAGLTAIARAFWRNDPYYPRPGTANEKDQELWNIFAEEYKRVGKEILEGEGATDLHSLVDEAVSRIEETRGKFSSSTHI